jgi:hypothetical protein
LLLAGAAAIVLAVQGLHPFLAIEQPVGARLLVVEGWMNPEGLDQAIKVFRERDYARMVTTGGPVGWPRPDPHVTFADLAAEYLKRRGLDESVVKAVPAPESAQDRTFLSAVMVREWGKQSGLAIDALDVITLGTHARRSLLLYRLAFGPRVAVGVLAARSSEYDPQAWWRSTSGARDVLDQTVAFLWVKLFFWPPPPGSHEERWAVPRRSARTES